MFFLVEREDTLTLHPKYFDQHVEKQVLNQLRLKVEGKCTGRWGYTIAVTSIQCLQKGRLHPDTGFAHFPVRYMACVFRPFKNEILPAKVTDISDNGFFCQAGPLEIFVSKMLMPDEFAYDPRKDDLPTYYYDEEDIRIEQGTAVRVKIVGLRLGSDKIVCIGTIKENYLGVC